MDFLFDVCIINSHHRAPPILVENIYYIFILITIYFLFLFIFKISIIYFINLYHSIYHSIIDVYQPTYISLPTKIYLHTYVYLTT